MAFKRLYRPQNLSIAECIPYWNSRSLTNERGCWLWQGATHRQGYAQAGHGGKVHLLHKLVWEHLNGPVPSGLELDHKCRVNQCWNPEHMEPVTHRTNVIRGDTDRSHMNKTHCPRGHEYTESNLYVSSNRQRICRTCARKRNVDAYWRRKNQLITHE